MTKSKIGGRIREHKWYIKMNSLNATIAKPKENWSRGILLDVFLGISITIDFEKIDNFNKFYNVSLREATEITT